MHPRDRFTAGRVANDAQLKMMKSRTIELLMKFIGASDLSFRQAILECDSFRDCIAQAAGPVRPRAKPHRRGSSSADGPQGCGEGVHCGRGHAIRRRCESLLRSPPRREHPRRRDALGTSAPPRLHGERTAGRRQTPAGSGLRRFRGKPCACAAALRATVVFVRSCAGGIAGFECDGLSAQANTIDANCDSCFFKDKLSRCSACWRVKRIGTRSRPDATSARRLRIANGG
jgi:hypothetical protein